MTKSRAPFSLLSDYINADKYLLLLGDIGFPAGRASAALFNGTALQPWIFTRSSAGQPGKLLSMFMESSQTVLKGNAPDYKYHFLLSLRGYSDVLSSKRRSERV